MRDKEQCQQWTATLLRKLNCLTSNITFTWNLYDSNNNDKTTSWERFGSISSNTVVLYNKTPILIGSDSRRAHRVLSFVKSLILIFAHLLWVQTRICALMKLSTKLIRTIQHFPAHTSNVWRVHKLPDAHECTTGSIIHITNPRTLHFLAT